MSLKTKSFRGFNLENLTEKIAEWLRENPRVEIVSSSQSQNIVSPGVISAVVIYKE